MYYEGKGVLQDYKQAYSLWNIAASQGNTSAANNRDKLAKKMTPIQLEQAKALSKQLYTQNLQ